MENLTIKFYKWDKDFKKYFHSCKKHLNIYNPQFYFPILSLYIPDTFEIIVFKLSIFFYTIV